jgi:hypothetical protein
MKAASLSLRTSSAALAAAGFLACSSTPSSPGIDSDTMASTSSSLSALAVSPFPISPAFSPDIHDYAIRCLAGSNAITVTATAAAGATVTLSEPDAGAGGATVSADLSLDENDAVMLVASGGGTNTEYWVRCLPHDFPTIAVTTHPDAGAPTPGYYLFGNVSYSAAEAPYAIVADVNGTPVWYRRSPNGAGILNVDSLIPGTISYTPFIDYTFGETGDEQYQIDQLSPFSVTPVTTVGIPADHHELRVLPNGNYLMLSDVIRTDLDLTGLGSFGPNSPMIDCVVQEIEPDGTVAWRWNAGDHFDPVADSTFPQPATADGQTVSDPFHCNSIDVDSAGNLLVSSRHMDSIFYISKATGAVLWKVGGATASKDGALYIPVQGDPETAFYRQHDARFQSNAQISLFDDHTQVAGKARGVVYTVDPDAGTATWAWQYEGSVSSTAMGSFRMYGDGERVIGWGLPSGGPDTILTEVNAAGQDVLDMTFATPDTSYRAVKVPLTALDEGVLQRAAGIADDP